MPDGYAAFWHGKENLIMSFNEINIALDRCSRKISFWSRAVYLELFTIVLFALLALSIRLSTDNYAIPVLLSGAMIAVAIFVCFSMFKVRSWQNKSERYSIELSLWKID